MFRQLLSVESVPPGALFHAPIGGPSVQNVPVLVVAAGGVVAVVLFRGLEEVL